MNEIVSVDEAIAKGHRMVTYPVMVIMFGVLGLCVYLGIQEILPFWIIPVGFVFAFVLAWLSWSVMITKWRLWAFENVRNVHELKKRAIQEKLIWADNSIFEKTEIRSLVAQEKWNSLQNKFNKKDVFIDDASIPSETIIYYLKWKAYVQMFIMFGCLAAVFYLFIIKDNYIIGAIVSIVGVYFGYKEYSEALRNEPQIIINDTGISTSSTVFQKWADIENEEVIREGVGNSTRYFLTYDYPGGTEHLQIDDFDTDQKSLNKLLMLYRGRSRKNNNHF
jgi:hypothetical protein